jgi:hypothetical protein
MFQDPTRPFSHTRFRWDAGRNGTTPDRGEFFWPRRGGGGGGKGPPLVETAVHYDELKLYTETAVGGFSVFVETTYRSLDPVNNNHAAGFGDMNLGTKSLLMDSELLQLSFQFKTYLLTGNFTKGLGTGHVSLEPAFLATVKVLPETWFQTMLAEWIPIAGDNAFAGAVFHYHFSLNHELARPLPDTVLLGAFEFVGYAFQDGLFTNAAGVPTRASGYHYLSVGPTTRLSICDKADIGFGVQFSVNNNHFADQLYRLEFRFKF